MDRTPPLGRMGPSLDKTLEKQTRRTTSSFLSVGAKLRGAHGEKFIHFWFVMVVLRFPIGDPFPSPLLLDQRPSPPPSHVGEDGPRMSDG